MVTGPTGSGKTTTLYTALMHLNSVERNIVTVEDPIEYQLPGITQIQVKPQIGLNFATLLRSILRHDPDTVMIGEIRDLETAQIAVQASLTGHLVLSTLHTNSAAATIARLRDMGLEDYLLTATLNGIMAQRLVRRLCSHCKRPVELTPEGGGPFRHRPDRPRQSGGRLRTRRLPQLPRNRIRRPYRGGRTDRAGREYPPPHSLARQPHRNSGSGAFGGHADHV